MKPIAPLLIASFAMTSLPPASSGAEPEAVPFGEAAGQPVQLFTLKNARGMQVSLTNFGGIVTSILVPDRTGAVADVTLGYSRLEDYLAGSPYFGCITGRYANRIAKAAFTLDGQTHRLAANNGENHLHGGLAGFDKKVWAARAATVDGHPAVILTHTSPDGDEGYPGALAMTVTYLLRDDNALEIRYEATTDRPTVVNLTNHAYFNLAGEGSGRTILDHVVRIAADRFTPTDAGGIPTGIASVEGTPLDFRRPTRIGERIGQAHEQLVNGKGYDHNYVVGEGRAPEPRLVAEVTEPTSGRMLQVLTTEPGLQFYVGNYLDGSNVGKSGRPYAYRTGFCLEAQVFPDSPNQAGNVPGYTSARLNPGETYRQTTVYRFGVANQ
jgi:aldose 1-epimerase